MTDRLVQSVDLGGNAPVDMSLLGLFMEADIIVKAVILILLSLSIWSWAIIFQKRSALGRLTRRAKRFEEAFWSGEPLEKLYERVRKTADDPMLRTFSAGMDEWRDGTSPGVPEGDTLQVSLRQRIERAMSVTIGRELQKLEQGMTFLASVGSTAPFIGLFGTVWGIMNSFAAIAHTNNTSLAVVAPGIAEALFATALGLVAAIPAVLAYNTFSAGLGQYADRLDAFSAEFTTILSRHLEQRQSPASKKAA